MGVTVSTSLAKVKENPLLLRFVGSETVAAGEQFWKELLSFTHSPPASQLEARLFDDAVSPLVETLIKNNGTTGHLRTLVRMLLDMMSGLRDESKCKSNLATLYVHNAMLIVRICLKQLLLNHSEEEVIVQLDGAATIPQITSLEASDRHPSPQLVFSSRGEDPLISLVAAAPGSNTTWSKDRSPTTGERSSRVAMDTTSSLPPGSTAPASMNAAEVVAMDMLLSRQLVEGLVSLLVEVPLLPFTYEIHHECMSLLLVLLSSQMYGFSSGSGILLQHILSIPLDLCNLLVQRLVHHFTSQPSPPPSHLRSPSTGLLSSLTSGIWSLVLPSATTAEQPSSIADQAVLLLLVLTHQQMHGHNPYRQSLFQFTDDHGDKAKCSFSVSLEKLYFALCKHLTEQTTLLLYLLLQGNRHVASFIFTRSDIDVLVVPLLHHLHDSAHQRSSHHVYMLLIVLLILSQDDCFNKSIHEVSLPRVMWYTERSLANLSLGSLTVIVLVRTIQANASQIQDKYLHTNCLAALANMSAHFHSLHLDAAQKLINLFKQLAKKHQKMAEKIQATPTSTINQASDEVFGDQPDSATDQSIVEEILLMILEIVNSCLTHRLQHNPHLIYSLLYQREVFEPFKTNPSLMDLIGNIENVVEFFSKKLEESGPSPYSSSFVLDTIVKASQTWPRRRLRVFPELKFRYVEEAQPEEFFVPYVWTLVLKTSSLHWQQFSVNHPTSSIV